MSNQFRPALTHSNETIESMLSHHSVRKFSEKAVDSATLEAILAAALSSPTSSNQNSWSVVVIEDKQLKRELAQTTLGNDFINAAPLFLVWLADLSRAETICTGEGLTPAVLEYQEALLLGTIDCALAAQNAVVAAESLGLGTCYVGGIRTNIEAVSELLGLPQYCYPVVGLALGWPDPADSSGVRPRLDLSGRAFRDTYDAAGAKAAIERLEVDNASYMEQQGKPGQSWIKTSARRWSDVGTLRGRENNREVIARRGLLDH